MSSKIYIDEEVGYLEAWEALVHLTDDWICGGNVSHETIMNMRDVIAELRGELAEYVELHSKVANELGTANHKLMQIEDLSKRESGLTPLALDVCPRCKAAGRYSDIIGLRFCLLCDGSGKRK